MSVQSRPDVDRNPPHLHVAADMACHQTNNRALSRLEQLQYVSRRHHNVADRSTFRPLRQR